MFSAPIRLYFYVFKGSSRMAIIVFLSILLALIAGKGFHKVHALDLGMLFYLLKDGKGISLASKLILHYSTESNEQEVAHNVDWLKADGLAEYSGESRNMDSRNKQSPSDYEPILESNSGSNSVRQGHYHDRTSLA